MEDESLIGILLTSMLEDLGCTVTGIATDLTAALVLAAETDLDAAILDLNLNGISSLPVADVLQQRAIPTIFSTGYGDLPQGVTGRALRKPYDAAALERVMREAMAEGAQLLVN